MFDLIYYLVMGLSWAYIVLILSDLLFNNE